MKKAAAALMAALLVPSTVPQAAYAEGPGGQEPTATPIKHLVVIFQENVSFDHYFGTYPHALNPSGQPRFEAHPGTPTVNGLTEGLRTNNPKCLHGAIKPSHVPPESCSSRLSPEIVGRLPAASGDSTRPRHMVAPSRVFFHSRSVHLDDDRQRRTSRQGDGAAAAEFGSAFATLAFAGKAT